jgi:predicted ATPase
MFKWLSLKKFSLLTFRWSNEESQILTNLIKYPYFYSDKMEKKIGKDSLKSYMWQTAPNRRCFGLRNNAASIGTAI